MDGVDVYFDDALVRRSGSVGGEVQLIDAPLTNASDYYPYGLPIGYRSHSSEHYRYGYQGQFAEKDEETGWNSFELRMYEPVIGRWTSTDPYGQYASPYIGMGNSPLVGIDPDGGFTWVPQLSYALYDNAAFWAMLSGASLLNEVVVTASRLSGAAAPAAAGAAKSTAQSIGGDCPNCDLLNNYVGGLSPGFSISSDSNFKDISDPDNYPGINIYTHPNMSGGITLPGIGIIVSEAGGKDKALLQHEYGHFLDYKFSPDLNYNLHSPSNALNFYLGVGIPSLLNSTPIINKIPGLNGSHRTYWTEIRANRWAEVWFGDKLAPGFNYRFPTKGK
jgi:RHS repeat-associated protein